MAKIDLAKEDTYFVTETPQKLKNAKLVTAIEAYRIINP